MAISQCFWHLVVKNGNFTFLLTSIGQEWQFHIPTDIHWSRMAISHCYWHLVVRNCYFTFLLTSIGQEWQFHIPTDIHWSRMTISQCYWHLVVKNGNWQIYPPNASWDIYYGIDLAAILDSSRKVRISSYFWIIREVNNQLALYRHVRCNPLNTPKTLPKTPSHDNKRFQLWHVIFASNTSTQNLSDEHTLADGPTPGIKHRCLEYCYTKLGRKTYFGQWPLGNWE